MDLGRTCRLLLLFGVLKLCSAEKPKCSGIFNGTTTAYTIDEEHKYSEADGDCDFSWHYSNNTVVANHKSKSSEVTDWSINDLTMKGCCPDIFLKRNCVAENKEFSAKCSASCNENPKPSTVNDNPTNSTLPIYPHHVTIPVAVTVSLVVVILVILVVLYKKGFFRKRSCGCMRGSYTPGKPGNSDSNI